MIVRVQTPSPIGVDAQSGRVHTVIGTAGNVSDVTQAQALLHGDETDAFGDTGYQGVEKREESMECPVTWHVAMRPSKRKALPVTPLGDLLERLEHTKASIRATVAHPFHVVKKEPVPSPQDALQGLSQKYRAVVLVIRLGQSLFGSPMATKRVYPRCVLKVEIGRKTTEKQHSRSQNRPVSGDSSKNPAEFSVNPICSAFP